MEKRASELEKSLSVTDLPIYETVPKTNRLIPLEVILEREEIDGVFFTSASTVRAFLKANPKADPTKITALCIGEMTARTAREAGMNVYVAEEASVEGLVKLTEQAYVSK